MVQSLSDIEIATRLLEEGKKSGMPEVDSNYGKLNCKIASLGKSVLRSWRFLVERGL